MTAQELIDEILHMTGVVAAVDTPSDLQRTNCLAIFNSMLDLWNGEGLLSPYRDTSSFPTVAGTYIYTIGPTGAFVAARPLDITMAEIRDTQAGSDDPVSIISWEDIELLDYPNASNGKPTRMAYQKTPTNGTIRLFPHPDKIYALRLTSSVLFSTLALNTVIDNNPGYIEAFKYNLAPRVAIYYSRQIDGGIVVLGENALRVLRRKAMPLSNAPVASGVLRKNKSYDIDRGY